MTKNLFLPVKSLRSIHLLRRPSAFDSLNEDASLEIDFDDAAVVDVRRRARGCRSHHFDLE
jgi:hypothetical protein